MPKSVYAQLNEYADIWNYQPVNAWEASWWDLLKYFGNILADILNAPYDSSAVQPNVTSAAALIMSAIEFTQSKNKVVYSSHDFPSLKYLINSWVPPEVERSIVNSDDGITIDENRMIEAIDENTLIVFVTHASFRSLFLQKPDNIIKRARECGAYVVLDVYQSAGVVPIDIRAMGPDFVIGGSIKWLCGGPGTGYLYVRPGLAMSLKPKLTGWIAHENPFEFADDMRYSDHISYRFLNGTLMTMTGVAVGLGNVWRFPYMVGLFGGSAFVVFYLFMIFTVCIPALMGEWALGRYTRRGPLGAFKYSGLPGGKYIGIMLFGLVFLALGYYSNTIGLVGFYGVGQLVSLFGIDIDTSLILPPETGMNTRSILLQSIFTPIVVGASGLILILGLRKGIERASKIIMPLLFAILIILCIRSLTLPNAFEGVQWFIGRFDIKDLTGPVMAAGLGQAIFSMSLGGTYMLIQGSFLDQTSHVPRNAVYVGLGDTLAGLLAGFVIFPAVFSFGLEPASGPSLIFHTLPQTFGKMPGGRLFGFLFFSGLCGAAFLSLVTAFEVIVSGIVDNTRKSRKTAVIIACSGSLVSAIPPLFNLDIFVVWDLIFGSGLQIAGAFFTVIAAAWSIKRSTMLKELARGSEKKFPVVLYWWMRIAVPLAVLFVGINWFLDSVLKVQLFS